MVSSTNTNISSPDDPPNVDKDPVATEKQGGDQAAIIMDLSEKLQTLKIKRIEDKTKLKEMEKLKIQNQQLIEFKRQILESQAELQKQLTQAKRDAEDAVQEKLRHADEMKDLAETAEIATLDKEMAEEKYEQISKEFESLKEKLEEVTVDFELLKNEVELKGGEDVANSYEVKKLQQQNSRYNEAIMKLRDLSAADKLEIAKLNKKGDEMHKEILKLMEFKTKNEERVKTLEENVCELKEQLDDALGSQEMVEILTEKNLELEEKVKNLQEEIDDLEKITEINEQLQEGARESELELREELDLARNKISLLTKKLADTQEVIANYESTVHKFRDLVKSLREENENLNRDYNITKAKTHEQKVENIEFKMRFAESKAFAQTVEGDLRLLEIDQYRKQIELLLKFLPRSFFVDGADNDAVQVILLVHRMIEKCAIIVHQLSDKFATVEQDVFKQVDRESVIRKTSELFRQQEFSSRLTFLLNSIQTILNQYIDALKSCPVDVYLKIASLYSEVKVHEKVIDNFIELLKKDQLDETVTLDSVEKVVNYFLSLYNVHLADIRISDCRQLLSHFVIIMKSGLDSLFINLLMIEKSIDDGLRSEESITIIHTYSSDIQEFCKKIRRHLSADVSNLDLSSILENEVWDCICQMIKVVSATNIIKQTLLDSALSRSIEELYFFKSLPEVDALITQTGGFKFLAASLNAIMGVCSQLSTGLQQGDFDGEVKRVDEPLRKTDNENPLEIRAKTMIDQSEKLVEYKSRLEAKENEISELKKALKLKISESSEMQIRKDIAEKKLLSSNKSSEERISKLQIEIEELQEIIKKKEREYEETLNHFQADIDSLQTEKIELKEKVKVLSKRNLFEGLTKTTTSPSSSARFEISSSAISALETSYMQQLCALRNASRIVKEENINLKSRIEEKHLKVDNMRFVRKLEHIKPIWLNRLDERGLLQLLDDDREFTCHREKLTSLLSKQENLIKETETFKNNLRMRLIRQKVFTSDRPFRDQLIEDRIERKKALTSFEEISQKFVDFNAYKKSISLF